MENKTLEDIKQQYADYIASLSAADKAKVDACKSVEELIALAQNAEGELPDEIAEAVAGGRIKDPTYYKYVCPDCRTYYRFEVKGNYTCSRCWGKHPLQFCGEAG